MINMLNARIQAVDYEYKLRFYDVTEEAFDELVDEDTKAELIDGVMVIRSYPALDHGDLVGFLGALLRCYAAEKDLGMVLGPQSLVHLKTGWKVTPSILFFAQDRMPCPLPEWQFEIAPDLVVEVLDEIGRHEILEQKIPAYKEAGVREIWVLHPESERIHVHRRRRKHYADRLQTSGRLGSQAVAGFWVESAWLWSEPRPNDWHCLCEILQ